MKRVILLLIAISLSFTACQKKNDSQNETVQETGSVKEVKVGPIVDKIYINTKMKEEIGIKDVAEGLSDLFHYGVSAAIIGGLDQETRNKLDIYSVPSLTWSLLFNPIPNKAPYTVKAAGEEHFNPFAIREVRFAVNYLINRKYIVDEILAGSGGPMMTMATPTQPGTYKYNLIASRMGLTGEGNEEKAIADITDALKKASNHPNLKNKLKKDGQWWTFLGKPVSVKFLIRVDDPQGRLKEGEYVALQIEKAGIKVERLQWDRSKCSKAVYGGNPANYEWNIYTEGWGAGATRAYWEHIVAQMYAPWYGYMPGGQDVKNWRYEHKELDEVTEKAYSGNFLTTDEYWKLALRGQELGVQEAVRIYVCYMDDYYVANKDRFNNRMVYGLGDGINKWSYVTADTKDGILHVTAFSAKGALFMSAWDPIGTDGFTDTYSSYCAEPASDVVLFESPATAQTTTMRAIPKDVVSKVERNSKGDVVGTIEVPEDAIIYNSKKKVWEKAGPGKTSMSKATYSFLFSNYHHGRPMGITNLLYADAFIEEWTNKDSEDDRFYDASFESSHKPTRKTVKGMVIHEDKTITSYFDYNFPPSKERVAGRGSPAVTILDARAVNVSWEISEACALIVAEGSKSGETYSFTRGEATEPDVLNAACVADIKAKLMEMKEKQYVPVSIKEYKKPEEAVADYNAAIQWIDDHKHAFISAGPFYIEKYDPATNYMELTAFRDPTYPFKSDYWPQKFTTTTIRIDDVEIPSSIAKSTTEDLPVTIYLSEVLFPSGTSSLSENGTVSLLLITRKEEMRFEAAKEKAGVYNVKIPATTINSLDPGTYTILVNAEIPGSIPAALSVSTTIH